MAYAKRRPGKTIEFVSRTKSFYKGINELFHKHAAEGTLHLLLNVDETSWKVVYRGELTYAKICSDTVRINDIDDDKACITSIATITADYTAKLPLCVIGKGVTERCCKQFEIEDDSDIGVFFSSSR